MDEAHLDVTACDREPIHIPGSIQPHGVMLVAERSGLVVRHVAGDTAALLGRADWTGAALGDILEDGVAAEAARLSAAGGSALLYRVGTPGRDIALNVHLFTTGAWLVVEIEAAPARDVASTLLPQLEQAATRFEEAQSLDAMFDLAAEEFQRLTGYDRVMIYRFLEDDSGVVVGERLVADMPSFLHHHFPAGDIPKQARDLYVRNLVRVIPDVGYRPAPLEPAWDAGAPLDLSDSELRSVSPIHVQYLRNMGVAASASVSIVRDGMLWGLVACHSLAPRAISSERRTACRALAAGLARQIRAREDTDTYRERVRLRSFEDDIVALLSREGSLDRAISNHLPEIMRMLDGDGVAVLRGEDLVLGGDCPGAGTVRALAAWVMPQAVDSVFATHHLAGLRPLPEDDRPLAAGLLAITLSTSEPWVVLWFRAEHLQIVNWAGNPHDGAGPDLGKPLTPRASFVAWSETVRGLARRWSIPEIEAAGRLRAAVVAVWQNRRIAELNRQLFATLDEKDVLLRQKQFLMREVNHRVQNSLQLVSSFLALQGRTSEEAAVQAAIEEARRRISAVSLVHRRLYLSDQVDAIDAGRYFDELLTDLLSSLGADWEREFVRDLEPVMLPTDRAIALGLILTELVINANKYAYGGAPGPLKVSLAGEGNRVRLTVADRGAGKVGTRFGFGSRMIEALLGRVDGAIAYEDNQPGVRAIVTAAVETPGASGAPRGMAD